MASRASGAITPLCDVRVDYLGHERCNRRANAVIRLDSAREGTGAANDMKGAR